MSQPGVERLRVDGRFLARGDERLFLKAVTFGPFPPERELAPSTEFARIAASGFNALRVYQAPDRDFLDCAAQHGLSVLAGVPWEWWRNFKKQPRLLNEGAVRLIELVDKLGDHPALGALLVANEIPSDLARWMGPVAVRDAIEDLIELCQSHSEDLLVAYSNYPSTEYLEPRNADFTAFNVYLEERDALRAYLPRLQNIAGDRPVVITEFGLDTIRHSEERQAKLHQDHLEECLEAGVAGTTLFSWSDRWWSRGRDVDDWAFGLTRQDESEKPSLSQLKTQLPDLHTHRNALKLTQAPRISIIVCTYNGGDHLPNCLRACLAVEYPDLEVVLVDDGSTDNTESVAAKFPTVRYVRQDHAGLAAARNRGAKEATGSLLAYTDDDCEPDRDWLFWIARAFENPAVGAAGGPNIPPTPDGVQEAVVAAAPGAPSHVLFDDLTAEHLPGCNLVIRRDAFEAIGGFETQYRTAGDDVDFCWRLIDADWRLTFVPPAFVWHRRRTSFVRYLKQQAGYGRAEALLFKAHPGRFNQSGIAWQGSVYAGGAVTTDPHAVIYFGAMGLAGYQALERHAMPRRELHDQHDGFGSRLLLSCADFAQPYARALARWLSGGPRPRRPRKPVDKTYRDDLRQTQEYAFLGPAEVGREQFLVRLQERGWQPCEETASWDLERGSCRLLTTDEQQGNKFNMLHVRLLHPPGAHHEILPQITEVALEVGLDSTAD